jgi:hypothetical protein
MRADGSRPWLGLAAFLAVSLASSRGLAAEPTISLRWLGAGPESGCLGQRGLEGAVAESLGRNAFSAPPSDREVVVWVGAREGLGYRAVIRVRDGRSVLGERELVSEGASCSTLDEPLAFAVALMVDSELPPPPEPEPEPEPEPKREPEEPRTRHVEFRRFEVDFALIGVSKALPGPTLGLDFGIEGRPFRWLGLRGHVAGLLPRSRDLGPAAVRFGLFLAGAAACPTWHGERLASALCVGFDWGSMTTETDGFASNTNDSRRFLATSVVGEARLRLARRLWLTASGGVLVPHDRERFTYRLDGEPRSVFQPSTVCPRLGIGAALEL